MQFKHTKWLDKIFNETLVRRIQTRVWVSRFIRIYSRQHRLKNNYILA